MLQTYSRRRLELIDLLRPYFMECTNLGIEALDGDGVNALAGDGVDFGAGVDADEVDGVEAVI